MNPPPVMMKRSRVGPPIAAAPRLISSSPTRAALLAALLAALCSSALFVAGAHAQSAAAPPAQSTQLQQAAQAWANRAWADVVRLYEPLARVDTGTSLPHVRLGVGLIAVDRASDAIPHLRTAEKLGAPAAFVAIQLAIAHATLNNLDSAFAQLQRATHAGMGAVPPFNDSTPAFARLRQDARFRTFEENMDRNARPCMYDPRHRQFDFWLGTWDVRPNGQSVVVGTNVITMQNEGCVIHESWTAPGSSGQSFNIFDRTREKWFQIWVDRSGGLHEYSGTFSDGAMRYEGEMPGSRGGGPARVRTRLTFFRIAQDTVRQLSENTADGKTWRTNYDFVYTRKR